jgi:hypothetical protein
MRADSLRLALLAGALAAGCMATPDGSPHVDRLTPAGGPSGAAAAVTIHGSGFFARAVQSASGGPVSVDTTHRAWLDGVELAGVVWVDEGTLQATIPSGLALGPHELTVENARGGRGSLADAWTVIVPAVLGVEAHPSRATASVGQALSLEITLSNTGGAAAHSVTLAVAAEGAGGVSLGALPAAVELPPGGSVALSVPLTATAPGAVALAVTASGTEAFSGRALTAVATPAALTVQARATLEVALSLPSTIPAGSNFSITMLLLNDGDAAALGAVPGALSLVAGSTGTLAALTGPTPAAADVPGHGSASFTWLARLQAGGTVQVQGGAAGTDANDGGPVSGAAVRSNVGGQQTEVSLVAGNPWSDNAPASALAMFGGRLISGPNAAGDGLWEYDPASGLDELLGVSIAVDLGPSFADNAAWRAAPPATTFGRPGCLKNGTACGPSNEDGRGVLAAGILAGAERLAYAGSAQHRARYVYLASAQEAPRTFQAVDLGAILPTTADAPTAAAFTGSGPLYLAFTDTVPTKSPHLVALSTAPAASWLDAVDGTDAVELGAAFMPGLGGDAGAGASQDPQPRLDAVALLRGSLYLASGGGVVRATVAAPRSYATHPSDWAAATPAGWAGRTSIAATSSVALTPADRAVPALVGHGACGAGPCLFLARNVVGGSPAVVPQVWRCDPTATGALDACEAGDWSLAVPDPGGDGQLTQLGVGTHGPVSVLLATDRYLYLGFDDAATGAQLYRSEGIPLHRSSFKGHDGCPAGTAGCVGLGGAGLGAASRTRFLDARAVTSGGRTTVYVAAGDGVGPMRIFAVPE